MDSGYTRAQAHSHRRHPYSGVSPVRRSMKRYRIHLRTCWILKTVRGSVRVLVRLLRVQVRAGRQGRRRRVGVLRAGPVGIDGPDAGRTEDG